MYWLNPRVHLPIIKRMAVDYVLEQHAELSRLFPDVSIRPTSTINLECSTLWACIQNCQEATLASCAPLVTRALEHYRSTGDPTIKKALLAAGYARKVASEDAFREATHALHK
jgi:hypothetical protein